MKQRLLVELDALLDTRMATIFRLNPDAANRLLNARYATRISDEMNLLDPFIDGDAYRQAYAERDLETLYLARPTQFFYDMRTALRALVGKCVAGDPDVESVHVDINVWPYTPNADHMEELKSVLVDGFMDMVSVDVVSVSPKELTTQRMLEMQWTYVYLYNFIDWSVTQFDGITERPTPVPAITMIAPKLVKSVRDVSKFAKEAPPGTAEHKDPHECMRVALAMIIGLDFACPSQFSLAKLDAVKESPDE